MKKSVQSICIAFSLTIILWAGACAPAATPVFPDAPPIGRPPGQATENGQLTMDEVEKLAGFDVREPAYFPKGVFFEYATYETKAYPGVTLHFKYIHEQYGDMGPFLKLSQEPQTEAPPEALSCQDFPEGCEVLQVNGSPVVYRLYTSPSGEGGNTEGFVWYANGFFFRLHRIAGEPNKIYKEDMLKMVESMQ